jgi:hypothetical protein
MFASETKLTAARMIFFASVVWFLAICAENIPLM